MHTINQNTRQLLLLFLAFCILGILSYFQWIPKAYWFVIIAILIVSLYIVVKFFIIIRKAHEKRKRKFLKTKNIIITTIFSFFMYGIFGILFLIIMLGMSEFSGGMFVEAKYIGNRYFYVYDIGFLDKIYEVRIKNKFLPITNFVLEEYPTDKIQFIQKGDTIFYNNHVIYNIKTQKIVTE